MHPVRQIHPACIKLCNKLSNDTRHCSVLYSQNTHTLTNEKVDLFTETTAVIVPMLLGSIATCWCR